MNKRDNNEIKKTTHKAQKQQLLKQEPRLKKLDIEALDDNFLGTAYSNGKTYHIKNVLPYERVEIEMPFFRNKEREKRYVYVPRRIITESPDRVKSICPYINDCGNCNLLHCAYPAQVREKTARFNDALKSVDIAVSEFTESTQTNCRNKVHLAFTDSGKQTVVGFFNEETHRVIPISKCALHGNWFESVVHILNKWATDNRLSPFKPWAKSGVLRFAVCRCFKDHIMITIVSRENIRCMDKLYEELCKKFKEVSLYLNINIQENSKVFSDKFIYVNGKRKLSGNMLGVDFHLSPNSFFQVNEQIAEKIYSSVLEKTATINPTAVVDAYSGIGITSLLFASRGYDVTSIEIVPGAVNDAKELAALNNLENKIHFVCGDCNNILPKLSVQPNTLFFVDPPRKGLGERVCNSIIKFKPEHIIYLSCDAQSLCEDIKLLNKGGYIAKDAHLFDMFPNTKHVESIVCLTKK